MVLCLLTLNDRETRRAHCQHQLIFLFILLKCIILLNVLFVNSYYVGCLGIKPAMGTAGSTLSYLNKRTIAAVKGYSHFVYIDNWS